MPSTRVICCLTILPLIIGCATPWLKNSITWNVLPSNIIYLVSSDSVNSESQVHNAFIKELNDRGFSIVDMKNKMPNNSNGTILKYKETWGWDFVMVISTIDVNLIDGQTKKSLGTAYWGRPHMHNYPSPANAVSQLMNEMDLQYSAEKESVKIKPTETKSKTDNTCTTEQILKMKEIGMTDEQVKAACK